MVNREKTARAAERRARRSRQGLWYYLAAIFRLLNIFGWFYNSRSRAERGSKPGQSDPWMSKWRYVSSIHRIFWAIYILPITLVNLVLAAVMAPFWMVFKRLRPSKLKKDDPTSKKMREKVDYEASHEGRDLFAPLGYGPEQVKGFWKGWFHRVWDMYCFVREVIHGSWRQGLQVCGVVVGCCIIYWQAWQLGHDFTNSPVSTARQLHQALDSTLY